MIVGRLYGKDIRGHGSKSAGLTNTLRVLGKSAAALVLVGDILKGVIACLIGLYLGVYAHSGEAIDCVSLLAAGAGAVIGHNWPVFFWVQRGQGRAYGSGGAVHDRLGYGPYMPWRLCDNRRSNPLCFFGHNIRYSVLCGYFIYTCLREYPLLLYICLPDGAHSHLQAQGKHTKAAFRHRKQAHILTFHGADGRRASSVKT